MLLKYCIMRTKVRIRGGVNMRELKIVEIDEQQSEELTNKIIAILCCNYSINPDAKRVIDEIKECRSG